MRVVAADTGSSWVAPYIIDLAGQASPRAIAAPGDGPARIVTDELRRAGLQVTEVGPRDWQTATGQLLNMIRDRELAHDGTAQLVTAAAGTAARPSGDGIAFSRRHSTGQVASLFAGCAASWVVDHAVTPSQPRIYLGSTAASSVA